MFDMVKRMFSNSWWREVDKPQEDQNKIETKRSSMKKYNKLNSKLATSIHTFNDSKFDSLPKIGQLYNKPLVFEGGMVRKQRYKTSLVRGANGKNVNLNLFSEFESPVKLKFEESKKL